MGEKKRFAYIPIFFNILLVVSHVFIGIITVQEKETEKICADKKTEEKRAQSSEYCFQLDKLTCLERGYRIKKELNKSLCCGHLGDHLQGLMGQELQENMDTDISKGRMLGKIKGYITQILNTSSAVHVRPAAHVGILLNGSLTGPDSGAPRIHWEKSSETSFVSGGLIHDGDRLRITTAGYYFVYTGLQYNVDPTDVDSGAIVAYVYRHVNGTRASRRKLMMSRESSCKNTRGDQPGPVSVYMAGIFLLREQDEISVRTHSQSLLNRSPATTYMGLHIV